MRGSAVLLALFPTLGLCAAEPPPAFELRGVTVPTLAPGSFVSLYGANLGPTPGCASPPEPTRRETVNPHNPDPEFANLSAYPRELCNVQVMIGGFPAELLYVSDVQINFKVPQDGPDQGSVDVRVVYLGQSSAAVSMPTGWGTTTVSLAEPAYAGMPVWLKVSLRFGLGHVDYPSTAGRAGFGCNEVEVRRDGKLLPTLPGANWTRYGGAHVGSVCGTYSVPSGKLAEDRLPLHLLYRFDTPGIYEVRYTRRDRASNIAASRVRAQSDWTPIEILPPRPNQRQALLESLRRRTSAAPNEILSDVLPNTFGFADDASFDIIASYLYDPSQGVRNYAMSGLYYWPTPSIIEKLRELLLKKGPNDDLERFLSRLSGSPPPK